MKVLLRSPSLRQFFYQGDRPRFVTLVSATAQGRQRFVNMGVGRPVVILESICGHIIQPMLSYYNPCCYIAQPTWLYYMAPVAILRTSGYIIHPMLSYYIAPVVILQPWAISNGHQMLPKVANLMFNAIKPKVFIGFH